MNADEPQTPAESAHESVPAAGGAASPGAGGADDFDFLDLLND